MSSARQAEPAPTPDLGLKLLLLCDSLDLLERGAFIFAVCEEGPLRQRLMERIREHLEIQGDRGLIEAELSPEQPDLAGRLEGLLLYNLLPQEDSPALAIAAILRDKPRPPVVFVLTRGLADAGFPLDSLPAGHPDRMPVEQARRALRALNFQRERLARLNAPLIFWLNQGTLGQIMVHAADVFAARSGIFYFETEPAWREPAAPPQIHTEVVVDLLDRFSRTLLPPEELHGRAALYEQRLERERAADQPHWPGIAFLCRDLANIYHEVDDYARAGEFQDQAIEAYQKAVAEREEEVSKKQGVGDEEQEWASLQVWLGNAYQDRMRGNRAENLHQAIRCYEEALTVYTPETAPLDYAMTQNNLGTAYSGLPTGDRADNLAYAIQCYQEALRFRTPEAAPLDYAMTQNNLGEVYRSLPTGDRAGNLARAIHCYQEALRFWTPETDPLRYGGTQNNLGLAYADLPTGDRAANLARAIECYQEALRFRAPETAPFDYAMTQNNLGEAYRNLPIGDRAANLARAIECYQEALRFRAPETAPFDYAMTQNNLGNAYADLPTGDRAANLARAIQCYQEALRFWTPETDPLHYAGTQNNLGLAYTNLPMGDRAVNLARTIHCFQEALRFYTPEAAPHYHEIAARNLERALATQRSPRERFRAALRRLYRALRYPRKQAESD